MTKVSLSEAYGYEPPQYYNCNSKHGSDTTFLQGPIRLATKESTNNSLALTRIDDNEPNNNDPLAGLSRMGLLDVLNHDSHQPVVLVIPIMKGNLKTREKLVEYNCSIMRRSEYYSQQVLVLEGAKLASISRDVFNGPQNKNLRLTVGDKSMNILSIEKDFRTSLVELWTKLDNKIDDFSNFLLELFKNQKDATKRNGMINFLLQESRGDCLVVQKIVEVFKEHWQTSVTKQLHNVTKALDKKKTEGKEETTEREKTIPELCNDIDNLVFSRFNEVTSGFVRLNKPLLSLGDVQEMHNMMKEKIPITYKRIKGKLKPKHTDFEVLWSFIQETKCKSQKVLGSFGLIFAYAFDAEGGGGMAQNLLEWQRQCSSPRTLERDKKQRSAAFDNDLHALTRDDNVLMCWDNFQKFIPIKFLRESRSVTDLHCTVRYAKKVNIPDKFIPTAQQRQPKKLTYLDQPIPAPPGMLPFECMEELTENQQNQMIEALLMGQMDQNSMLALFEKLSGHPFSETSDYDEDIEEDEHKDASTGTNDENESNTNEDSRSDESTNYGKRVMWYQITLHIANTLRDMKRYLISTTANTDSGRKIIKVLTQNRKLGEQSRNFQQRSVKTWHDFEGCVADIFPLRSSVHKESSIEGNGNVFAENAQMSGFLSSEMKANGLKSYFI